MGRRLLSRSAPYVVVAHRRRDVRVQVQELTARRDQRDEHDQRDQSKDERVLNHSLALLDEMMMNNRVRPESLTVEAGVLVAYSCMSLLDHHTDHPLAPAVAEIGIVQRLDGLGDDLR